MENLLEKINKIVIKVGTAGITTNGDVDKDVIENLAKNCFELREAGKYVTVVTSGAIAAGRKQLNSTKEGTLTEKQTYAAVGQPLLMQHYREQFGKYKMHVAQFLVNKTNFDDSKEFETLHNSYLNTLLKDIVPVFNENDTVATDEIKFSDNDELQALIAINLRQDAMVNLIVYDGLLKNRKVVDIATSYDKGDYDDLKSEIREGRGGLEGKLDAIKKANNAGNLCIVGNAKGSILDMIKGSTLHTRFLPQKM
jgi:glutamate 5-kinase